MRARFPLRALMALSVTALLPGPILAQECALSNCVLRVQPGANTEGITALPARPLTGDGFAISIDGSPEIGAAGAADRQRQADVALSQNDIEVRFDGLGIRPRLDVQTVGNGPFAPGQTVTFRSRMTYPQFVQRGELHILDLDAPGGARTLAVVPLAPNGDATLTLPQGRTLAYLHRVIDAANRRDKTRPILLGTARDRDLTDLATEQQGTDSTALRAIPLRGGAVTVHVRNLPPGARVLTLGTTVTPDPGGQAVVQRILPPGPHRIGVQVIRPDGTSLALARDLTIPASEWAHVGVADLSLGRRSGGGADGGPETTTSGRLSGYAKGTTATGLTITAQADSGEDRIEDLFRNILNKDPAAILNRLDPDLSYPTYGDDSTLTVDTPTSGGVYLKVEKNGNFGLWGDFKSVNDGTTLLRNERSLYGAQAVLQSRSATEDGTPRLRFEGYAAQPDQLPQRDVLRGTGGSVYFLTRQDILIGSETLSVERRDATSQRVISRSTLVQGRDYDINYAQGVVTLYSPLSGYGSGGALLSSNPNGDDTLNLVAQYEWRPALGDVDGYAYGGRLTLGLGQGLRLGATAMTDTSGTADQRAYGLDLAWQGSGQSNLQAEVARTEGPGFGTVTSLNGGLTGDTTAPPGGSGTAFRLTGQLALDDVWQGGAGLISGYAETYGAGFSSLDRQVTDRKRLWGFAADLPLGQRTDLKVTADHHDRAPDIREDQGSVILLHRLTGTVAVELGYGHLDSRDPTRPGATGTRSDLAARLLMTPSDRVDWYVFGQGSVSVSGDLDRTDRIGLGGTALLGRDWSVEAELSDGATGTGARILLGQDKPEASSVYFGYTLDPDRTLDDVVLTGRDRGQLVAGGRKRHSSSVTTYAENTRDLFGNRRSLTSAYGIDYQRSARTVYTAAVETGQVTGDPAGPVDRTALSLGVRHDDGAALTLRGRVELIRDSGPTGSVDTLLLNSLPRYQLGDDARIIADLEALVNETASDTLPEGSYLDATLGYALRPVRDDRLNLLAAYRYLGDTVGQQVDGTRRSPLQRSHVFSIDGEYALSPRWTIGGKIGGRLGESAADRSQAFARNDAWLAVANARYHLVHDWDVLVEARRLSAVQAGTTDFGALVGVYKQIGAHVMLGGSYNFGRFSDDLTDLTRDDRGAEINLIATF